MEDPKVTHTERHGYPSKGDMQTFGNDVLGNAIYQYDDVIAMPEGIYRAKSLTGEQLDSLIENGGIYQQME